MIFCVMPVQVNGFISRENKKKLTPVKNACFSPDIPIEMLKARAKEQGGTLNDVLMTVLSLSFSQYLAEYTSDKITKQLWLSCPFSLRPPPKHVLDFTFDNEFAILPIKMQLVDSYQSGFQIIKRDMNAVKKSMTPFGFLYVAKIVMAIPNQFFRNFMIGLSSNRMTFVFSNVPGPTKNYVLSGNKTSCVGFFVPGLHSCAGGIAIISINDVVKIGLTMDKVVMKHPKILMDMITKNLDDALGKNWRDFKAGGPVPQ